MEDNSFANHGKPYEVLPLYVYFIHLALAFHIFIFWYNWSIL